MINLKKILRGLPKYDKPPKSPFGDLKNVDVAEQTLAPMPRRVLEVQVPEHPMPPIRLRQSKLWFPEAPVDMRGINVCIWYDGTLRPMRGHKLNCQWTFDGQIWKHL